MLPDECERGFDLILCRNAAVFLSEEAKEKLITRFAGALRRERVPFVGATEIIVNERAAGLGLTWGPSCRRSGGAAAHALRDGPRGGVVSFP